VTAGLRAEADVLSTEMVTCGRSAIRSTDGLELAALTRLKASAEGRAVPISELFGGTADVTALALGFASGKIGSVAVTYARVADR
jgi:hypothetical protein